MKGKFLLIDQLKNTIEITGEDINEHLYVVSLISDKVREGEVKKHKTQFLLFEEIKRFLKEGKNVEV